jgi:periplasmic protein TonB
VLVRFTVARDGEVTSVSVVRGSGSAILDQAAEAILRNARLPPFSAEMTADALSVSVPIHYRLER